MNKFFFLLIVIITLSLKAEEYKVTDQPGFDQSIKKAKAGDTIILSNGEWNNCLLKINCSGEGGSPILIKAETPGQVILTGSSSLKIGGNYIIVDGLYFKEGFVNSGSVIEFRSSSSREANYSRLTNCAIEDYNPPDKNKDYKWISLYGTHNRVDHCFAGNKIHSGCLLVVWLSDKPNYHLIDSNYFGHRPELGYNGGEIIRVGTSEWSMYPSYTTVEHNYFEECNGEREIISNKSFFNTYHGNTFTRCKGTLTLRHGNNCVVEGNYFFGEHLSGTGGIRIIGENHTVINNYLTGLEGKDVFSAIAFMNGVPNSPLNRYFQVKNAVLAFNTLVDNKINITFGTGADSELSLPPINSTIANNIIYTTAGKIITEIAKPENFLYEGNIFFDNTSGIDPLLVKGEDGLFRLGVGSPAIGTAKGNYNELKIDFDGQERGSKKDVGCDQFSDAPIKSKPMNKSNTGPSWMREKK